MTNISLGPNGLSISKDISFMNKWKELNSGTSAPSQRFGHGMVFNEKTNELIMFGGGKDNNHFYSDTWIFNISNNKWINKTTITHPAARMASAMVYDKEDNATILFGGYTMVPPTNFADTWVYYNNNNTWVNKSPSSHPSGRFSPGMAYDDTNATTILFGGAKFSPPAAFSDTWIYNLSANIWTSKAPSTHPSARNGLNMVYDEKTREMIIFGGGASPYANDTWVYNISTNNWTNLQPINAPRSRAWYSMVFDRNNQDVLLFGGLFAGGSGYSDETWIYNRDSNNWFNKTPTNSPMVRESHSMAYDSNHGEIILFGGIGPVSNYNDTWAWNYSPYDQKGQFISSPINMNGTAYFGSINWTANIPNKTNVRLQIKTAETKIGLSGFAFIGPDGTTNSYYTKSGQRIYYENNGSKWIQYELFLNTSNLFISPTIKDIQIYYNLIHNLTLSSPVGGENWTGNRSIFWNASDSDGDNLTFDIDLISNTSDVSLVKNLKQNSWSWNTSSILNGTYTIRVTAHDNNTFIPLSVNKTSGGFTIHHPKPNSMPTVTLLSPLDNATINKTAVQLKWSGNDNDGDVLTYFVFFDNISGKIFKNQTKDTELNISGLDDNKTYFWTVIPNDGKVNGSPPKVWKFNVNLPIIPVNHPPVVETPKNATISVNDTYKVIINATDPDNDTLLYRLWSAPAGATYTYNEVNWKATKPGNNTFKFEVGDGHVYINVTWNVEVKAKTVIPPKVNHPPKFLNTDLNQTLIAGEKWTYNISVMDPDNDTIALSIPDTAVAINGTILSWTPPNPHSTWPLTITASDGKGGFANLTIYLTVKSKPKPTSGIKTNYGLIGIIVACVAVAGGVGGVYAYSRRRKKEDPQTAAHATSSSPEPERPMAQPIPVASQTTIDDVFLIYRDGRLISHHTRKLKPDMDDEVLGGMFTAIQEFIKTSFGGDEETPVDEISYGKNKILIEHGKYIFISAVIEGRGSDEMHERMKIAVQNIEVEFEGRLKDWSGDVKDLKDAKKWLKAVISGEPIVLHQ